jgi:hypothetical protein
LQLFASTGAELTSTEFVALVDAKFEEERHPRLANAPARFGLTDAEYKQLQRAIDLDLAAVLRVDQPRFDLDTMLNHFDRLWGKS